MGLFSKLAGLRSAPKKANDELILVHAMLLMAGVDGYIEDAEIETVEAFVATLPEFRDKNFGDMIAEANKLVARYGGLKESVKAVGELSTPALRRKAFVLAADIAMSSGDVDDKEEALLETMQRILDVDSEVADKILEVLSLKYAK